MIPNPWEQDGHHWCYEQPPFIIWFTIQIKDGAGSFVAGHSLTCKATKCNNRNILETSCSGFANAVILSVCLTSEIVGSHTSSGHHHGDLGNTDLFFHCGCISGTCENNEPLWVFHGDLYKFLFIIFTNTMWHVKCHTSIVFLVSWLHILLLVYVMYIFACQTFSV